MDTLYALLFVGLISFGIIGAIRRADQLGALREQINKLNASQIALRREIDAIMAQLAGGGVAHPTETPTVAPAAAARPASKETAPTPASKPAAATASPSAGERKPVDTNTAWQQAKAPASVPPVRQAPPAPPKPFDFERQFGASLPVWIGGIALALGVIFLVKYSIDQGYLSPTVRCVLGAVFGIAMIGAAQYIRSRPAIANGARIAQALSGAGIAALYGVLFAATSLYELIPSAVGFAGMAAVTAAAVLLSLQYGAPIAVLGLVGGFLTPALVSSNEPNAPVLFTYLFALTTGLFLLIRHRGWWWLAWPTIGAAFLWLGLWIVFFGAPGDSIWLSFFILASVAVVLGATTQRALLPYEGETAGGGAPGFIGIVVLGVAVLFLAAVTVRSEFDTTQWALFGLLSAASIALAAYDEERYRVAPWLALVVSLLMLLVWRTEWTAGFTGTLLAFAALFVVSGYALMWRVRDPLPWALQSAISALLFYLLAYARLHAFTEDWDVIARAADASVFPVWGAIAMGLAALATLATGRVMEAFTGRDENKQQLLAVFAVAATTFLSLGLGIELKREFLSVAFAVQVLMLAWLDTRIEIKALRPIAGVVAAIFAVLIGPQILLLVELTGYAVAEARLHAVDALPVVDAPLFQLGVPALMFAGASVLLRRRADDGLTRAFEGAAIALFGVMGYYLIRHFFYKGEDVLFSPGTFFERGVITNVLFAYALALLFVAKRFARTAVEWGAVIVGGIAAFRILFFDLLVSNPLFVDHDVGQLTGLNYLLLPFGLPVVWLWLAARMHPKAGGRDLTPIAGAASLVLAFVLVSLNVRQFYQGSVLHSSTTTDAEIYTYSIVWLAGGIALLFFGTLWKDRLMRYASLALMILTVGKVFLYDASELTGLLRVFSFFGLGLSLLGLSWFYTRFVFAPAADER